MDALARDDVDSVAICTPSGAHAEQAVSALEPGKHVVIEKPVHVCRQAARRLIAAEATAPGLATVISQQRFDASSLAVRETIRQGFSRLGRGYDPPVIVPTGPCRVMLSTCRHRHVRGAMRAASKGRLE